MYNLLCSKTKVRGKEEKDQQPASVALAGQQNCLHPPFTCIRTMVDRLATIINQIMQRGYDTTPIPTPMPRQFVVTFPIPSQPVTLLLPHDWATAFCVLHTLRSGVLSEFVTASECHQNSDALRVFAFCRVHHRSTALTHSQLLSVDPEAGDYQRYVRPSDPEVTTTTAVSQQQQQHMVALSSTVSGMLASNNLSNSNLPELQTRDGSVPYSLHEFSIEGVGGGLIIINHYGDYLLSVACVDIGVLGETWADLDAALADLRRTTNVTSTKCTATSLGIGGAGILLYMQARDSPVNRKLLWTKLAKELPIFSQTQLICLPGSHLETADLIHLEKANQIVQKKKAAVELASQDEKKSSDGASSSEEDEDFPTLTKRSSSVTLLNETFELSLIHI